VPILVSNHDSKKNEDIKELAKKLSSQKIQRIGFGI
jgi:ABC-type metal ion transport system substrate-binding protein